MTFSCIDRPSKEKDCSAVAKVDSMTITATVIALDKCSYIIIGFDFSFVLAMQILLFISPSYMRMLEQCDQVPHPSLKMDVTDLKK